MKFSRLPHLLGAAAILATTAACVPDTSSQASRLVLDIDTYRYTTSSPFSLGSILNPAGHDTQVTHSGLSMAFDAQERVLRLNDDSVKISYTADGSYLESEFYPSNNLMADILSWWPNTILKTSPEFIRNYSADDRLLSAEYKGRGQDTVINYNYSGDQLTSITQDDSQSELIYSGGKLREVTNSSFDYAIDYDSANSILEIATIKSGGETTTTRYTHNAQGQLTKLEVDNKLINSYTYTSAGVDVITGSLGEVLLDVDYDSNGFITTTYDSNDKDKPFKEIDYKLTGQALSTAAQIKAINEYLAETIFDLPYGSEAPLSCGEKLKGSDSRNPSTELSTADVYRLACGGLLN